MCIHPLYIYACGHHFFAPEPLVTCAWRDAAIAKQAPLPLPNSKLPRSPRTLGHGSPYPTTKALNQRLASKGLLPAEQYKSTKVSTKGSPQPTGDHKNLKPVKRADSVKEGTCRKRGHPFRSHFIKYLCDECDSQHLQREQQRQERFEKNYHSDGLVEHVRVEEWQWRVKFGEKALPAPPAGSPRSPRPPKDDDSGYEEGLVEEEMPKQLREELELGKRVEEREMLRAMEEANKVIEGMKKKTAMNVDDKQKVVDSQVMRKSEESGKRDSWTKGLRASWKSVEGRKGGWLSGFGARVEY